MERTLVIIKPDGVRRHLVGSIIQRFEAKGLAIAEMNIDIVRKMVGTTKAADAVPGTIRGDYALPGTENIIHASDSRDAATKEIARFFPPFDTNKPSEKAVWPAVFSLKNSFDSSLMYIRSLRKTLGDFPIFLPLKQQKSVVGNSPPSMFHKSLYFFLYALNSASYLHSRYVPFLSDHFLYKTKSSSSKK